MAHSDRKLCQQRLAQDVEVIAAMGSIAQVGGSRRAARGELDMAI